METLDEATKALISADLPKLCNVLSQVSAAENAAEQNLLGQTKEDSQTHNDEHVSREKNPAIKSVGEKTPEAKKSQKTQETEEHWYDVFLQNTMPNWLVVVGSCIASLIAWRTLGTLRDQVAANIESAHAAKDANIAARQALEITQRARVFCQELNTTTHIKDNAVVAGFAVMPQWKNTASTPAINCALYAEHKIIEISASDDIDFQREPIPESTGAVIGTSAIVGAAEVFVPIEDALKVWNNEARLFVWTFCEYNDVFQDTNRHLIELCVEIKLRHDPRVIQHASGVALLYKAHGKHSKAD